jgi:dipeptidyl aminopeptidase/acylaminoacyl peptidase
VPKLWNVLALVLAQGTTPSTAGLELQAVPGAEGLVGVHLSPIPLPLERRVLQYAQVRTATLRDVSEDGHHLLIGTNFGNTEQLHRVSMALGTREQLTFFEKPVGKAAFLPGDPGTLFFLEGSGLADTSQLLRLDLRTARSELLTDGKSRHETFILSKDGRWIAYSGTGRDGRDTDVYLAEVADARNARRLTELDGTWLPLEFSPDGQKLLVKLERAEDDADVWLLDAASGARRLLTPEAAAHGKASVKSAFFSADGKAVYLLTDRGQDFITLQRVDLSGKEAVLETVLEDVSHDVEHAAVAKDGTLVYAVNESGYSRAYVLRGKKPEALPLPPCVVASLRFARDVSDSVFLALESPTSPLDVYEVSLKTKKLVRWTKSEVGGLDARAFVTPELVRYKAQDGLALSGFFYRPGDVPKGKRLPVVVSFHDGPAVQERPVFHPEYQALLEQGIAVLAPNVRGSDGSGKAFRAADDGVKRAQVLEDIAATLAFLGRQPDVDASRIACVGTGYGGYLALAAAAFYPAEVRAAVDVLGMAHLPTFIETEVPYRRDALRAEYGDERLPEVRAVLERLSPLGAAPRMQGALLVVQGKKDTRAPRAHAEQLVQARGKDGYYLLALEEGRGPWRKERRDVATMTLLLFLQQKLLGAVPRAPIDQ